MGNKINKFIKERNLSAYIPVKFFGKKIAAGFRKI